MNKKLKTALKVVVSVAALYLVATKIDLQSAFDALLRAKWSWLLLGLLAFFASRIIGALRSNLLFRQIGITFSEVSNFFLYWLGMYYSLFLPSGIGGDGYKVYYLNKKFETPLKQLIATLIIDRANGMMAIGIWLVLFFYGISVFQELKPYIWLTIPVALMAFYIGLRQFYRVFVAVYTRMTWYSMALQLTQILSFYCILLGIGEVRQVPEYLFLFLVSSLVTVLPITLGGIGARELTFLFGAKYLGLNTEIAVVVSLLFYFFNAILSLGGGYFSFFPKYIDDQKTVSTK